MSDKMTIKERLASLEQKVVSEFGYIKDKIDNHLETHSKKESRLTAGIITLGIGLILLVLKMLIFNN